MKIHYYVQRPLAFSHQYHLNSYKFNALLRDFVNFVFVFIYMMLNVFHMNIAMVFMIHV